MKALSLESGGALPLNTKDGGGGDTSVKTLIDRASLNYLLLSCTF